MTGEVKLVHDARAELAEGPVWDAANRVLYWVDIPNGHIHVYSPATGNDRVLEVGQMVGAVALRIRGGLVLALENGFYSMDFASGSLEQIHDPESDKPNNRFNDGKCDPSGSFWAGTMSKIGEKQTGKLYRLDRQHQVREMIRDVDISNGLGWSPDSRTMYFIDSPTRQVVAYDWDPDSGDIANPRTVVRTPESQGVPDGMTVDEEGMLWVAQWGGYRVNRWNPHTGELLQTVSVPAAQVSCCVFGGERLDELYITTAREGLNDQELDRHPHNGGIFVAKPGVRGIPAYQFEG